MAQQIITTVLRIDDLDGTELGEQGNTVEFAFDGKTYAIDLSDKNVEKFRNAMGQYVEHARHVTPQTTGRGHGRRASSSGGSNPEVKQARAWLVEHGLLKADSRGRISSELMEKYRTRGIPSKQTSIDTTTSTTSTTAANAGAPKKDGVAPAPTDAPRKTAAQKKEPASA